MGGAGAPDGGAAGRGGVGAPAAPAGHGTDILRPGHGVVTVDAGGALVYMNPAAESLLGSAARDWLGRPCWSRGPGRAGAGVGGGRTLATRRPVRTWYETHAKASAECGFWASAARRWSGRRSRGSPGGAGHHGRLQAEAASRRADRLEAVAELAASLAHEIKNPLASIRSAVEQLTGGPAGCGHRPRRPGPPGPGRVRPPQPPPVRLHRVQPGGGEQRAPRWTWPPSPGRPSRWHASTPTPGRPRRSAGRPSPVEVEGDRDLLHRVVFNLVLNAAPAFRGRRHRPVEMPPWTPDASPPAAASPAAPGSGSGTRGPGSQPTTPPASSTPSSPPATAAAAWAWPWSTAPSRPMTASSSSTTPGRRAPPFTVFLPAAAATEP
jgi:two-component system, NtrC family, sensor histidine kinase PilS